MGRFYLWFVIITAALAALPRLLLANRLAELQQAKLQKKNSILRSKKMSLLLLAGIVFSGVGYYLYYLFWHSHELLLDVAIVYSVLVAAEFFFQARFPSLDSLIFQNRLLGILYLGLSIGSFVLLRRL